VSQDWWELILAADMQSAIACCQFYLPATPPGGLSLSEFIKTRTKSAVYGLFFHKAIQVLRKQDELREKTDDK